MEGDIHLSERLTLATRVLDSVKQCQIRFGGKTELATETDSRVSCLCSALEAILQHGLKHNNKALSTFKQMTEVTGLTRIGSGFGLVEELKQMETEPTYWPYVKQHLSKHELQRYAILKNITTDAGRGRAWLRSSLNEHSLEKYMHMIEQDATLSVFYEAWSFLRDQERCSMLPNMAAGLRSILFAISIDNPELNSIKPAAGWGAILTSTPPTRNHFAQRVEDDSRPVIAGEGSTLPAERPGKDRKKKKLVAHVVSFDETDLSSYGASPVTSLASPRSLASGVHYPEPSIVVSGAAQKAAGGAAASGTGHPRAPEITGFRTVATPGTGSASAGSHQAARVSPLTACSGESTRSGGRPTPFVRSHSKTGSFDENMVRGPEAMAGDTAAAAGAAGAGAAAAGEGPQGSPTRSKTHSRTVSLDTALLRFVQEKASGVSQGLQRLAGLPTTSQSSSISEEARDDAAESNASRQSAVCRTPLDGAVMNSGDGASSPGRGRTHSPMERRRENKATSPKRQHDSERQTPVPTSPPSVWQNAKLHESRKILVPARADLARKSSAQSLPSANLPKVQSYNAMEDPAATTETGTRPLSAPPVRENSRTASIGSELSDIYSNGDVSDLGQGMTPLSPDGQPQDAEGIFIMCGDQSSHGEDSCSGSADSVDVPIFSELTASAAKALAMAQRITSQSETYRTQGDGSHAPEKSVPGNHDTMTTGELKEAVIAMMMRKDEVEEQNKGLKMALELEMELTSALRVEMEEQKKNHLSKQDREADKVRGLTRENELLKHQLKKYVNAVQMLRRQGADSEDFPGIHLDDLQPGIPPSRSTIDYSHEASEYEKKLVQVAEMHGELMEFNELLQRQLIAKESLVERLRREMVNLRGPLPDDCQSTDDTYSLASDADSVVHRTLIHVWIPSAFLKGGSSDAHHVFQIYVRICDEEWNIYRRYSEFRSLHSSLKKTFPVLSTLRFPPKKAIGNKDPKFVETRRRELQRYIRQALNLVTPRSADLTTSPSRQTLLRVIPFFGEPPTEQARRGGPRGGARSGSRGGRVAPEPAQEGRPIPGSGQQYMGL